MALLEKPLLHHHEDLSLIPSDHREAECDSVHLQFLCGGGRDLRVSMVPWSATPALLSSSCSEKLGTKT